MGYENSGDWRYVRRSGYGDRRKGGPRSATGNHMPKTRTGGVHADVQRIAVSFFVANLPKNIQSADLWTRCAKIGIVVDVFIAPNLSKMGRRYGFVRFVRITDKKEIERKLCEIWMGSYLLFTALATNRNDHYRQVISRPTRNQRSKEHQGQEPKDRRSYAGAVKGEKNRLSQTREVKSIRLQNNELTGLIDVESTVLAEVRDATSIPNLLNLCREEGFSGLNIRYICKALMTNVGIQNVFSKFKNISSDFVVPDRMVWLEIHGLPMCAWNPCAYKKWLHCGVTTNSLATGKVCVRTGRFDFINEKTVVHIGDALYTVYVKEMAMWEPEVGDEGCNVPKF
ncbi:hypothetical protein LXL04_032884 [Taraxacum kok-saghyz]